MGAGRRVEDGVEKKGKGNDASLWIIDSLHVKISRSRLSEMILMARSL